MLKQFYKQDQKDIVSLTKKFLLEDFFVHFSKWRNKVSVLIEGSVASGRYDRFSDIDLRVIVPGGLEQVYSREQIQAYKKHLREIGVPIQLHTPIAINQLTKSIEAWERDGDLRELASALIVFDPKAEVQALKKRYKWYPRDVAREKIRWLIAESVFRFEERFIVAQKRADLFFGEVNKLEIMRFLLNACLLANKRYPCFDKHLYAEIQALEPSLPRKIIELVDDLLRSRNLKKTGGLLDELLNEVEGYCAARKLIKSESRDYWIGLRPKHRVSFE